MAQQGQRHHAGPFKKRFKQYEQPWHKEKFTPVRNWLQEIEPELLKDVTKRNEQLKYLSHTSAVLEQGQDDLFGVNAAEEDRKLMTKLPAKLFNDFEPGGGLCIILQSALKYKLEMGWKPDGFEAVLLKEKNGARANVALFQGIEIALLNAGHLVRPKIFIPSTFPKPNRDALRNIVVAHHGLIATTRNHATHELMPDVDAEEPEAEYVRTLETQDRLAKVHWWYYPDSYQEWKPLSEIQGETEPPIPTPKLWKVYARFVRDLDKFNEWMNEEDYMDTEEGADGDGDGEGVAEGEAEEVDDAEVDEVGGKRKRDDDDGAGKGKSAKGDDEEDAGKAIARPSGQFRALPAALSKLQTGSTRAQLSLQSFAVNARPFSTAINGEPPKQLPAREPTNEIVVVPSYASWFKFEQIHPIEKRAMSEWFRQDSQSKSPKTYVESRDLIINMYRESPRRYLTATECRRHLAVDVCSVIRLHGFLEHWGLINYNITLHDKPVMIGPMNTAGHPILLAMPDGSLVPKEEAIKNNSLAVAHGGKEQATPAAQLGTSANVFAMPSDVSRDSNSRVLCVVSGEDCTRERYHCVSKPEVVISPAVYASGEHIPAPYTAADFVRVSTSEGEQEAVGMSDWTETETLRLLEALEQYGEDWGQVADYVHSKTKEQCVMHFLRLPIEDRYLEESQASQPHSAGASAADSSSQLLAQIAFLCQSVAPDVANKATNAAFSVLLKAEAPGKAVELAMRSHSAATGQGHGASAAAAAGKGGREGEAATQSENKEDGGKQDGSGAGDAMETEGGGAATGGAPESGGGGSAVAAAAPPGESETDAKLRALKQKAQSLAALAGAALRAKSLAMTEEKEIQKLVSQVVKRQMEKIESKLTTFATLERLLLQERDALEKRKRGVGARQPTAPASGGGAGGEAMVTDQ